MTERALLKNDVLLSNSDTCKELLCYFTTLSGFRTLWGILSIPHIYRSWAFCTPPCFPSHIYFLGAFFLFSASNIHRFMLSLLMILTSYNVINQWSLTLFLNIPTLPFVLESLYNGWYCCQLSLLCPFVFNVFDAFGCCDNAKIPKCYWINQLWKLHLLTIINTLS